MIIMLSQHLVVAVVEVGAELGKKHFHKSYVLSKMVRTELTGIWERGWGRGKKRTNKQLL